MQIDKKSSAHISEINIRNLFGYLNYSISNNENTESLDRLLILYGDNGSGKTTILKLIFSLLSPIKHRGEKGFVAETKFEYLEILFSDGTKVSARKTEGLSGPYTMEIARPDQPKKSVRIKTNSEMNVRLEDNPKIYDFLEKLSELNVSLYFLPDDRRATATFPIDSDDQVHRAIRKNRRIVRGKYQEDIIEVHEAAEQTHHLDVEPALDALISWVRRKALRSSNAGEQNATTIFLDLINRISSTPNDEEKPDTKDNLLGRILRLQKKTEEFANYGLITQFPGDKFLESLKKSNKESNQIINTIISPYLDGIDARLDAMDEVKAVLQNYIDTINEFIHPKQIKLDIYRGVSFHSPHMDNIQSSFLSSGEKQLILLLTNTILARDRATIFVIDEPEISLNIKWQRKFIRSLLRCSEGSQVQYILASHSIELISQFRKSAVQLSNIE